MPFAALRGAYPSHLPLALRAMRARPRRACADPPPSVPQDDSYTDSYISTIGVDFVRALASPLSSLDDRTQRARREVRKSRSRRNGGVAATNRASAAPREPCASVPTAGDATRFQICSTRLQRRGPCFSSERRFQVGHPTAEKPPRRFFFFFRREDGRSERALSPLLLTALVNLSHALFALETNRKSARSSWRARP